MRRREKPQTVPVTPGVAQFANFSVENWHRPAEDLPVPRDYDGSGWEWIAMRSLRRWDDARRDHARALGYDPQCPYGSKPGRDWWAYLALLESVKRSEAGLGVSQGGDRS